MGIIIMECHHQTLNGTDHLDHHPNPLLQPPPDDHDRDDPQYSDHHLRYSNSNHLSSQRSLQSVPSLASTNSKPHNTSIHCQYCLIANFRPHSTYLSSITLSGKLFVFGKLKPSIQLRG
ncbi:hypothetical protein PanWU01x14_339230 [Parasponia andersonii]|uniref:Uncharacterized protein n=1 Tax=Parasponia andersonii TaxID=3476 RepID=A0A2P5AES7_PARAD|nr:hypothetical protein PanWU01x14_339230 [Parasponia andersonii]